MWPVIATGCEQPQLAYFNEHLISAQFIQKVISPYQLNIIINNSICIVA